MSPRGRRHLDPSDGIGGAGLNDMMAAGFEPAVSAFDLDAEVRLGEVETNEFEEQLRRLSEDGVDLVVVGAGVMGADAVETVAAEHPETNYVVWDYSRDLPNVAYLNFGAEKGSFPPGAAAALESRTGIIRFVGDLAFSVDFIDDIRPRLEELRAQIGLGKITVPTVPANTGDGASEEGA